MKNKIKSFKLLAILDYFRFWLAQSLHKNIVCDFQLFFENNSKSSSCIQSPLLQQDLRQYFPTPILYF